MQREITLELELRACSVCNRPKQSGEFMAGEWLLVAPVYTPELSRDGIYFPGGADWFDMRNQKTITLTKFTALIPNDVGDT